MTSDRSLPQLSDGGADTSALTGTNEDYSLPFHIETAAARGRLVRLGPVLDEILGQHDYPEPVAKLLGEAVILTVLLGAALKSEGRLTLQTSSEGPVGFVVVQYRAPGKVRGYVSFDSQRLDAALEMGGPASADLLGSGHLAMTIEPGSGGERYQGFVDLKGEGLAAAAHAYFSQSEQIPSLIRIAIARHFVAGQDDRPGCWTWRGGGLLLQRLGLEGEGAARSGAAPQGANPSLGDDDEDWRRGLMLASTVEDHEMLDPMLAPEHLLFRLFHEERVRVFTPATIAVFCQCTRARVAELLGTFSDARLSDMADDGKITVTCEFCNRVYVFDALDVSEEAES